MFSPVIPIIILSAGTAGDDWILKTNFWDDSGSWHDEDTWND